MKIKRNQMIIGIVIVGLLGVVWFFLPTASIMEHTRPPAIYKTGTGIMPTVTVERGNTVQFDRPTNQYPIVCYIKVGVGGGGSSIVSISVDFQVLGLTSERNIFYGQDLPSEMEDPSQGTNDQFYESLPEDGYPSFMPRGRSIDRVTLSPFSRVMQIGLKELTTKTIQIEVTVGNLDWYFTEYYQFTIGVGGGDIKQSDLTTGEEGVFFPVTFGIELFPMAIVVMVWFKKREDK